ncbi:MAG: Hsp20 family protein [Pseudomonadota bacterium]
MSRVTFASHPFLLGFEDLDRLLERSSKTASDGYPPYNIEQRGEDAYRITIAVAGFSESELSVTLEDRQLMVRGRRAEESKDRIFLHRGIAERQFQRSFVLSDRIEVDGATLTNGLLQIDLVRRPLSATIQTITINGG